jgi:nucleoside-diphosphate-sugar epimerase
MRVLVTGAAGFVGLNLVRRFADAGDHVDALARRAPDPAGEAFAGPGLGSVAWHVGDVTDRVRFDALVAALRPDAVVHAAAVTFTAPQEAADPARVFDVNAGGTLNVLEAARRHGVGTFVYVSSSGLYGANPPLPALDESARMNPGNLYAISKIASEHLCARYAELTGMRVRVGRLGTAYGPMERATGSRTNLSGVQQVIRLAETLERPVRVAGAEIARDFVHVDDVAEAFYQLTVVPEVRHVVYNVGAARSEPLSVALDALVGVAPGFAWERVDADDPAADVRHVPAQARAAMDLGRLEGDTPWRWRIPLAEGARATWTWRRAHPDWIAADA